MKGGLAFRMKPRNKKYPMLSNCTSKETVGWGGRIRTSAWRNQNPQSRHDTNRHKLTEAQKRAVFIDLAKTHPDTRCHDFELR
jgi:hypothetical protein